MKARTAIMSLEPLCPDLEYPGVHMPWATRRACTQPGCHTTTTGGRCDKHQGEAEQARGNRHQRGYGRAHTNHFRPGVLRRDPLCACTDTSHGHGPRCIAPATVADHHPLSRRDLVAQGKDPDDPAHGRGLCEPCHNKHTAKTQPGGWHSPPMSR